MAADIIYSVHHIMDEAQKTELLAEAPLEEEQGSTTMKFITLSALGYCLYIMWAAPSIICGG